MFINDGPKSLVHIWVFVLVEASSVDDVCESLLPSWLTYLLWQAWRSTASTNTDPVQFMQEQDTMVGMVFPYDDVMAVLRHDEDADLSTIAVEIRRLYSTGVAGRALMSGAVRALCEQDLQQLIATHLLKLANTDVTEALFVKTLAECKTAAEKTVGISCLSGRRVVSFDYRGLELKIPVGSVGRQCEMALRIALRAAASLGAAILALPSETDLVSDTSTVKMTVHSKLCSGAKKARQHLWDALREQEKDTSSGNGQTSGEDVEVTPVQKKQPDMMSEK
eukprot:1084785-Amphidinium_carterae.1